jgi:hypothetical protein
MLFGYDYWDVLEEYRYRVRIGHDTLPFFKYRSFRDNRSIFDITQAYKTNF